MHSVEFSQASAAAEGKKKWQEVWEDRLTLEVPRQKHLKIAA